MLRRWLTLPGVTEMRVGAGRTVTMQLAEAPAASDTVIVAMPSPRAITSPEALTVATDAIEVA